MALDTRNKRASALGIALACRLVLPASDGGVVEADRQQLAGAYSGISTAAVVTSGRDTRASILGLGLAPLVILPEPDGSITGANRQHLAFAYAGIDAGAGDAATVTLTGVSSQASVGPVRAVGWMTAYTPTFHPSSPSSAPSKTVSRASAPTPKAPTLKPAARAARVVRVATVGVSASASVGTLSVAPVRVALDGVEVVGDVGAFVHLGIDDAKALDEILVLLLA